jgi:hypothetical protein
MKHNKFTFVGHHLQLQPFYVTATTPVIVEKNKRLIKPSVKVNFNFIILM